jgi:CTP:molybdopterin cytidylyltransferase MocA
MADLAGDVGAQHLIGEPCRPGSPKLPMSDDAVLTDIDTPEALAALPGKPGTKEA